MIFIMSRRIEASKCFIKIQAIQESLFIKELDGYQILHDLVLIAVIMLAIMPGIFLQS